MSINSEQTLNNFEIWAVFDDNSGFKMPGGPYSEEIAKQWLAEYMSEDTGLFDKNPGHFEIVKKRTI